MDEEEILSPDGRINLPAPSPEALEAAAEDVLGPGASEAFLTDGGKVFRGGDGIFVQDAGESCGTIISQAPRELKDRVMDEAAKVRKSKAELAGADYIDPEKNEFIKLDQD